MLKKACFRPFLGAYNSTLYKKHPVEIIMFGEGGK
jgi:hypothetical protein